MSKVNDPSLITKTNENIKHVVKFLKQNRRANVVFLQENHRIPKTIVNRIIRKDLKHIVSSRTRE